MSGVVVKMRMSPADAGALYMKSLAQQDRITKLETQLVDAVDRINDLLKQDDGQAYKEAERFLERYYKESRHD